MAKFAFTILGTVEVPDEDKDNVNILCTPVIEKEGKEEKIDERYWDIFDVEFEEEA